MIGRFPIISTVTLLSLVSAMVFCTAPTYSRQLFTVYCNPIDPGSANCNTIPDGLKIKCIASSGGLAQCFDPASKLYVNCVPYQSVGSDGSGGAAVQLACYSNSAPGATGTKFKQNILDDSSILDAFSDSF